MISQLTIISRLAFILAIFIAMLMTLMFYKMIQIKEKQAIQLMTRLGIPTSVIQGDYLVRASVTLLTGIGLGLLTTQMLGRQLGRLLLQGLTSITIVNQPLVIYFVLPLALSSAVWLSVCISNLSLRKIKIL